MNAQIIGDHATPRRQSRHHGRFTWLMLLLAVWLAPVQAPLAASPAAEPFVMGTNTEENSLSGKWHRRIYGEAFRRMGVPLTVVTMPIERLTVMANAGEVHGQPLRLAVYAQAHPNQLRVDEVVHDMRLALYGFDPGARAGYPNRLEDLATGKWTVEYQRGILLCEKTLKPLVPADKLSDITSTAQGMNKLRAGRTDLFCDFDVNLNTELLKPEFKGATGFRPVLDLGLALPLYPYVHKSRADLAPQLAATLKKMKAEGLIERYLVEAKRELEAAR